MSTTVAWQEETLRYDRPHSRLVRMAHWLRGGPERNLLDVGCATAHLKRLLPDDFDYHGCDIADHAAASLDSSHFVQLDFNQSTDLSHFAERQINVIHLGGVLEYLHEPGELLQSLRSLVPPQARLVTSIINFRARRYAAREKHHRGWIYQPTLPQFEKLLTDSGWKICKVEAARLQTPWKEGLFRLAAVMLGPGHRWVERRADQYYVDARAA